MGFEVGNNHGRRFAPGQSGNPAGRPPKDPMTSALKSKLEAEPDLLAKLVEVGIRKATFGDFRYWKEIFDRLDGKVSQTIRTNSPEPIDWSELDDEGDTVRPSANRHDTDIGGE